MRSRSMGRFLFLLVCSSLMLLGCGGIRWRIERIPSCGDSPMEGAAIVLCEAGLAVEQIDDEKCLKPAVEYHLLPGMHTIRARIDLDNYIRQFHVREKGGPEQIRVYLAKGQVYYLWGQRGYDFNDIVRDERHGIWNIRVTRKGTAEGVATMGELGVLPDCIYYGSGGVPSQWQDLGSPWLDSRPEIDDLIFYMGCYNRNGPRGVLGGARQDDISFAQECLANGADINATDKWGNTPLHWAVAYDRTGMTRFLLTKGANPNVKQKRGLTPLHCAAINGNLEIARLLIDYSTDPNIEDSKGRTPMYYARTCEWDDLVQILSLGRPSPTTKQGSQ